MKWYRLKCIRKLTKCRVQWRIGYLTVTLFVTLIAAPKITIVAEKVFETITQGLFEIIASRSCIKRCYQGSVLQRVWNVLVKPAKNSNTAHSTRVLTLVRTRYTVAALRGGVWEKSFSYRNIVAWLTFSLLWLIICLFVCHFVCQLLRFLLLFTISFVCFSVFCFVCFLFPLLSCVYEDSCTGSNYRIRWQNNCMSSMIAWYSNWFMCRPISPFWVCCWNTCWFCQVK